MLSQKKKKKPPVNVKDTAANDHCLLKMFDNFSFIIKYFLLFISLSSFCHNYYYKYFMLFLGLHFIIHFFLFNIFNKISHSLSVCQTYWVQTVANGKQLQQNNKIKKSVILLIMYGILYGILLFKDLYVVSYRCYVCIWINCECVFFIFLYDKSAAI